MADNLSRGIVLSDMDAIGTAGNGQVRRIVHDESHVVVVAELGNGLGFFVLGAPFLMFFPVLDNGDAGSDQFFGDVHIAPAQAKLFIAHDGIYRIF